MQPVVVGVDGSTNSQYAVRVAAGEAGRRGRVLRIVHAAANTGDETPAWDWIREDAEQLAAQADPSLTTISEQVPGPPASVLIQEGSTADLVVVGNRGLGGFTSLLAGSVATQVAAHCPAPVLVARGQEHDGGQVVVGVDATPASTPAVAAAFAQAVLRGADLCAVHTWAWPVPTGAGQTVPLVFDEAEIEDQERRLLAEALAGMRERYPDVTVQQVLVKGQPAGSLVRLSETAQLLVVGRRGRGGFAGLVLGSVSRQVLHHSASPVLIVPPEPWFS